MSAGMILSLLAEQPRTAVSLRHDAGLTHEQTYLHLVALDAQGLAEIGWRDESGHAVWKACARFAQSDAETT